MFASCAIKEKGDCRRSPYFDLEGEFAHLSVLVFAIHEELWEYGFNQHTKLQEDEEL